MTWVHADDTPGATQHAGHLLARLPDGTIPTYRVGKLLAERRFADAWESSGGRWQGPEHDRPDQQPAHLVPACECGWHGADIPYDVYGGGVPGTGAAPMRNRAGMTAVTAWRDHAAAALTNTGPDSHRQALAQLAATLAELADERPRAALTLSRHLRELAALIEPLAVAGALAHGVTWPTIGADLGQSRQAVHGRYRNPSADLTDRVHRLTGHTVEALLNQARKPGTAPPGATGWNDEIRHLITPQPTQETAQ
ncbi:hypothetical protein [Streptomyces sp. IB2014 011-1]|uniref:hypothetical protein n=1 Tax=Streptomyces sp. IB2014 011-1 TaxID=1844478 RepID=UPI000978FEF6|nr:hypothetical protein [Streptomyces sp. IB2014 011-1]ONI48512.1 hypothetical protein STIB_73370 [Streptomyces sp. IB2014 011-1]